MIFFSRAFNGLGTGIGSILVPVLSESNIHSHIIYYIPVNNNNIN